MENFPFFSSDCNSDSDFPGPFGDRNQHDVHDSDSAYHERNSGNPAEKIGLLDDELVFVPHEITVDPYPAFKCGVIFPRAIFGSGSESDTEEPEPEVEGKADAKTDQEQSPAEEAAAEESASVEEAVVEVSMDEDEATQSQDEQPEETEEDDDNERS